VGVDDVEAPGGAEAPAQPGSRSPKRTRAGRELIQLDIEAIEATERGDLVADELSPLRVDAVSEHV
jgi:hypothetical protein